MNEHDKLREAIKTARDVGDPESSTWCCSDLHRAQMRLLADAAESTLPKTREASVYIIIGTSKETGNVCLSRPIYGAFGGPLPDQLDNFKLTCDAVRVLGPFPQEVPA